MASATSNLTFEQFRKQYHDSDRDHEFWYGNAIPKGTPTWIHGLLQRIIMGLLRNAGFHAAPEVELRIIPEAHPRPDVVATRSKPRGAYPTTGLEVVVEILSQDDSYLHLKDKCRRYQEWGFGHIVIVDPVDRSVAEWKDGTFVPVSSFAGIAADRIWQELDLEYEG